MTTLPTPLAKKRRNRLIPSNIYIHWVPILGHCEGTHQNVVVVVVVVFYQTYIHLVRISDETKAQTPK